MNNSFERYLHDVRSVFPVFQKSEQRFFQDFSSAIQEYQNTHPDCTFEELKEDLLERAKKHNACQDGYRMGSNAKSKQDLLKAITDNWYWVLSVSKMIDANYLENNFSEEELAEAGIYTRKEHLSNAKSFACGSATVKAYGSATVEACNNSYVEDALET